MRGLPLGGLVLLAVLVGACGGSGPVPRLVSAQEAARKADLRVCAGAPGSPTDVAHEPATRRGTWNDVWRTGDGCIVRADAVTSFDGAEHCHWESIRYLVVGEPVGSLVPDVMQGAWYVRDPEAAYKRDIARALDLDATLPADAIDTGFREGTSELWIVPGDASAVYRRSEDGVERWPLDPDVFLCE